MRRVIVFDLGGVLVTLKEADGFVGWLGSRCRPGALTRTMLEAAAERVQRGDWSVRRLYAEWRREAGLEAGWPEFRRAFCGLQLGEALPGAREFLEDLRRRGRRIVLLSNTNAVHVDWVRGTCPGLLESFDRLYLSHRMRRIKPEEGIFRELMRREGSAEFALVDDTPENVATAEALGWRGLRSERNRFDAERFAAFLAD